MHPPRSRCDTGFPFLAIGGGAGVRDLNGVLHLLDLQRFALELVIAHLRCGSDPVATTVQVGPPGCRGKGPPRQVRNTKPLPHNPSGLTLSLGAPRARSCQAIPYV